MSNTRENSADPPAKGAELTALVGCGAFLVGVLLLILVFGFFYTVFHAPVLSTLYQAEVLVGLFANVVVACYAFPAFRRTKDRALLCIAFAALSFAYGALFTMLLGARPPSIGRHIAHIELQWYFATRYATAIIGVVLYAYGVVSLIRRRV